MYSMLFYTLIAALLFMVVLRLAWPFLWIFFVLYVIYYIYRLIKYKKFMKEVDKTKQEFEKQWQEQTTYRSSNQGSGDIIDADYTVKDDNSYQ